MKTNSKLLPKRIVDSEVAVGSAGMEGRERLKTNDHAARVPRVPPRTTLDALVTLVGSTSTGMVWFSFRGPLTHPTVQSGRDTIVLSSVGIDELQLTLVGRLLVAVA